MMKRRKRSVERGALTQHHGQPAAPRRLERQKGRVRRWLRGSCSPAAKRRFEGKMHRFGALAHG
jgi:hypothetical protein